MTVFVDFPRCLISLVYLNNHFQITIMSKWANYPKKQQKNVSIYTIIKGYYLILVVDDVGLDKLVNIFT